MNTTITTNIPPFDHNDVLPPHLGNPTTDLYSVTPYKTSIVDFCMRYATNERRKELLMNLVRFRIRMHKFGIIEGYQWIAGSFIENIENSQNRFPNDIDVVTCYMSSRTLEDSLIKDFEEFVKPELAKETYNLDHYPFVVNDNPWLTVMYSRYWTQLFSHTRNGVWKGMIEIALSGDVANEEEALKYLTALEL